MMSVPCTPSVLVNVAVRVICAPWSSFQSVLVAAEVIALDARIDDWLISGGKEEAPFDEWLRFIEGGEALVANVESVWREQESEPDDSKMQACLAEAKKTLLHGAVRMGMPIEDG